MSPATASHCAFFSEWAENSSWNSREAAIIRSNHGRRMRNQERLRLVQPKMSSLRDLASTPKNLMRVESSDAPNNRIWCVHMHLNQQSNPPRFMSLSAFVWFLSAGAHVVAQDSSYSLLLKHPVLSRWTEGMPSFSISCAGANRPAK